MKSAGRILALLLVAAMLLTTGAMASSDASGEASGDVTAQAETYSVDGMTAAEESIIRESDGETGYSLTGYIRSITLADGSTYMFDENNVYLGYSIVNGEVVEADSNWDVSALTEEDGVYQINLNAAVDGDSFTAAYVLGNGSVIDVSGSLIITTDEEASGYYDDEGNFITANSDMSATGAALAITDGGQAYVHDLYYVSEGFVRSLAVVWGDGEYSTILDVRDSEIYTLGADPISETPEGFLDGGLDFNTMICPPWVLGLYGGTRTVNILNEKGTLTIVNSTFGSAGWAILSADSCTDPVFNVVDSTLIALTSDDDFDVESDGFAYSGADILGIDGYEYEGETYDYGVAYGTYAIGGSMEYLYGVTVLGTTYATICTGGTETNYYSSNGSIDLIDAIDLEAYDTVEGAGNVSRIYSVFGFMSHGSGDIGIYDGTEVYTEDAIFLYRDGEDVTFTVDDSILESKNGVILQMLDNDDAQAGGPAAQEVVDMIGLPTEVYGGEDEGTVLNFNLSNGAYEGNLYNATGWYHSETWGQPADTLNLVIDSAELTGAVSTTKSVHAVAYYDGIEDAITAQNEINAQYGFADIEYVYMDENLQVVDDAADAAYVQFTYYTKLQYWILGHVINAPTNEGNAVVNVTLKNGAIWNVTETCYIDSLTVDDSSVITTDDDHLITVTVDGVETDIIPGETYSGDIVINVVDKLSLSGHEGSMADWAGSDYRAAIYLDEDGLEESASALSAAVGYSYDDETGTLTVGSIESQGTTFNGIIVNEGSYRIQDGEIVFNGDGGNDFNGYGAAILITGENTEVIIDNVSIDTTGLVRGAMATANSAKVLVMNSTFQAHEGVLPDDYVQNVENVSGIMKAVPWTLGLTGNNRATNLLGSATSTYFNSYISADGWGVLSADDASEPSMNVVNSTIYSDGEYAYGLFGIGTGSVIRILGSEVDVSGLGINLTSGYMLVGPATEENLDGVYGAEEIMVSEAYDDTVNTTLISGGTAFRIGSATADIQPGTVIETGKTAIVSKGGTGVLNMDGVSITADNGIILQLMDSDDAGADFSDPICPLNTSYTENDVEPIYIEGRDLTEAGLDVTIANMELTGDFYNSSESYTTEEAYGVSTSAYNLNITFENSTLEGVITASLAQHVDPDTGEILTTITTWQQVGSIVNTARPVINNGVNVTLTDGSVWTVTGDSYLSSLNVDDDSQVIVPEGVTLTVGETSYTDTVITATEG